MMPTLRAGDYIFTRALRAEEPLKRGMIVLVADTPAEKEMPSIKRIAGLPGETIAFFRGMLIADGKAVPYPVKTNLNIPQVQIAPDSVYLLGDNPAESDDSRLFGALPRKNIIELVLSVYWPPHHWQNLV